MKRLFVILMAILMCLSMGVIVSAHDDYIHEASDVVDTASVAAAYPACPSCGGRTRTFGSYGSNSHIVRCGACRTQIVTESCSVYFEATCVEPGTCICGRELTFPLSHSYATVSLDSSSHGVVCTRSGCSRNPSSYGYTGSFSSSAHSITYSYNDYTHNTTGERWHSKSGTCSVCEYEYYKTTRCKNQGNVCNRLSCFGD